MNTIIYLVRHGESIANRDDIIAGHFDSELSEEGRKQALKTKQELEGVMFDVGYSSDLKRAVRTAEIILGKSLQPAEKIFDFRERKYGDYEGKSGEHLQKLFERHQTHYDSLSEEDRWLFSPKANIESNHALSNRFLNALEKVAQGNPGKTILVATHGGCIRTALIKLGYATRSELGPGSFSNAGYAELSYDEHNFKVVRVVGIRKSNRRGL